MTLILKLDLDMVKMYYHAKNEVSMSMDSKVLAQTDTYTHTYAQTDRQYKNITFPHMRAVITEPQRTMKNKPETVYIWNDSVVVKI